MAVRNDFTAGEVLAAADLNDTFASKVDYALPTNAQTGTTYTFVAADAEKLTTASNASPVTLTIPPASSVAWPANTVLRVVNYGAGAVTIDGGSGVTVTNTASTIAQYGAAVAIRTGSDAWTVVPFGGGDIPAAEVSSPAATGQYTDSGITYDYYTFTSSGTLVVDTGGFVDVLVVGGGGGGGVSGGGGGGAGGMCVVDSFYLPAASHSIVIGAGGAGGQQSATYAGQDGRSGAVTGISGRLWAPGGGGGGQRVNDTAMDGHNGGSGGGGGGQSSAGRNFGTGGSGYSGIGNNGGTGTAANAGGGGGAGGSGGVPTAGTGASNSYTGSAVTYAAGGAGSQASGTAGTANTGNGGSGRSSGGGNGGAGGSGIVVIRVKV